MFQNCSFLIRFPGKVWDTNLEWNIAT